ncbi:MAG: bifunctional tetrahydrofolate synthase/dihydrofolate synthase [Zoogloeaceae bacterium]|jgi:dihydrofolate synthase/folylpolyglutamate synthase|nr:bifunctional tetrahydrofolate synthase/dihydrofolate synthase [Zoogloeaceae bacterium]
MSTDARSGGLRVAAKPSLEEWLLLLESRHPRGEAGIELGLARVRQVGAALGHFGDSGRLPACPLLTIAGTNGKGSTAAFLEAILHRAGYRVGCYASPHLLRYNERVRVGGVPVEDAALCAAFAQVEAARRAAGDVFLTYFEFGTLAAWQVFAAAGCEVLILEVGLGGRLDAVNLYDPDVALVTSIDLDHQDWLGATREAIGREKAGIFRAGRPALCGDAQPPEGLVAHAASLGAPLQVLGRDFGVAGDETGGFSPAGETPPQWRYWHRQEDRTTRRVLAHPALRGAAQLKNAALALAALETLGTRLPVSMQAIRQGLAEAHLPGRFQVLPGRPVVVLDVGHNPEAMRVLAQNLASMGFYPKTRAVLGMLADKDVRGIAALRGKVDHWFLTSLPGPRGLCATELARRVAAVDAQTPITCCATPLDAFAQALAASEETDRILIFGSFLTVAPVLADGNCPAGEGLISGRAVRQPGASSR